MDIRGRHFKSFSIIAIRLYYDFALSHNAFILSRIVTTYKSHRSEHIRPVIASYSYRSGVIDELYHIYLLLLLGKIAFVSKNKIILYLEKRRALLLRVI